MIFAVKPGWCQGPEWGLYAATSRVGWSMVFFIGACRHGSVVSEERGLTGSHCGVLVGWKHVAQASQDARRVRGRRSGFGAVLISADE
jgi:hypothetical protein